MFRNISLFRKKILVGECFNLARYTHMPTKRAHVPMCLAISDDKHGRFCHDKTVVFSPRVVESCRDSITPGRSWKTRKMQIVRGRSSRWLLKDEKNIWNAVHPGRLTWNLQITHLERKMIFQTSMRKCSMLIFQGVQHSRCYFWWGSVEWRTSSFSVFSSYFMGGFGSEYVGLTMGFATVISIRPNACVWALALVNLARLPWKLLSWKPLNFWSLSRFGWSLGWIIQTSNSLGWSLRGFDVYRYIYIYICIYTFLPSTEVENCPQISSDRKHNLGPQNLAEGPGNGTPYSREI